MDHTTIFTLLNVTAGIITLFLFIYVIKYRTVVGTFSFMLLMVAATIWSFGNAFELMSSTMNTKIFWRNMQQFGVKLSLVFWLGLIAVYTGRQSLIKGWRLLYWSIIPIFCIFLVWTNDSHELMRKNVRLVETNNYISIEF